MSSDDLDQLLLGLKLKKLREIIARELERAEKEKPSYQAFLCRVMRLEYEDQQERFREYRVERAKLPERWALESFPWKQQPGVDKRQIEQLAELDFVARGDNVVFIGPPGVGKTGLATGLLLRALYEGRRCLFVRAQDLFDEMYASLADRGTRRLLDHLVGFDCLLVDEMGYLNLRPEQTNIFFKLMEERYARKRSTVLTTNLDYDDWGEFLGKKDMVQALLSRLRHRCITVRVDGPSLREPTG